MWGRLSASSRPRQPPPPPRGGGGRPPPPPPMSSTMSSSSGNAVVPGMMNFSLYFPNFPLRTLFSGIYSPDWRALDLDHLLWRDVLRHEIFGHVRHAELVSFTIHHWVGRAKIVGGRRRGDAPFE